MVEGPDDATSSPVAVEETHAPTWLPTQPRVFAAWSAGEWQPIELSESADGDKPAQERKRKVAQTLGSVMAADQVVALFGLGPSAGVGGPRMSDLWTAVRADKPDLFKEMQLHVGDTTADEDTGDIEELLSKCQLIANAPVAPHTSAKTFINGAELVIAKSCREFVDAAGLDDHAHVLRLLARRSPERSRARVFTTNYDLCIERAAAQNGVMLIDGFGRETPPVFDGTNYDVDFVRRRSEARSPEYLDGVLHFVKLHGSVDWAEERGQIVRRENSAAPVIIYPRRDKFELSYRQPFLESISQLQTSLRQPNLGLLIAGFGFSDAHLSEMLFAAVRKNLGLRIVVATLGCENHCDSLEVTCRPKMESLMRLAEHGDSRITLLDCDFATLARLMPDVGTETDEDRLKALVRTITT